MLLIATAPATANVDDAALRHEAEQRAAAAREAENRRARNNALWRSRLVANRDEDRDGVLNANDWCLRTRPGPQGTSAVDEYGCAPYQRDNDGDGVMDAYDHCPGTPGRGPYGQHTLVDEEGCEIWVWADGTYTTERVTVRPTLENQQDGTDLSGFAIAVIKGLAAYTAATIDVAATDDLAPVIGDYPGYETTEIEYVEPQEEPDEGYADNHYVAMFFDGIDWLMHPPAKNSSLRTGLLCAAAAGLIGLLAGFVTQRTPKRPVEEPLDRRYMRRDLPVPKRR
jgi:hypothetical protein